jgi:formyl-CoA transferase
LIHLRVLEFGPGLAAAWSGKLLSELGAEVVRVDAPPADGAYVDAHLARAQSLHLHRRKRRVAIDYARTEGRALLDRLAAQSDVVVTDEPPPTLDALRWDELGGGQPRFRVSITPYGLSGPLRDATASAATLLAQAGHTFLTGDPGRAPLTLPGGYPELQAAHFACIGLLAAWLAERRGAREVPRRIEVSMLETLASLSQFTTVLHTYEGRVRSRHGNRWENLHPLNLYPCRDGWLMVNVVPNFWDAFTFFLGDLDLRDDPRFATSEARLKHADALDERIAARFADRTRRELATEAQETFRVPVGALQSFAELLRDPQLAARGFLEGIEDDGRSLRAPGHAFRLLDHDPSGGER